MCLVVKGCFVKVIVIFFDFGEEFNMLFIWIGEVCVEVIYVSVCN